MGLLDDIEQTLDETTTAVQEQTQAAEDWLDQQVTETEQTVDVAVDQAMEHPASTVVYAATKVNPFTPTVDIDDDATDGTTGVKLTYYGQEASAAQDAAGNTTVTADVGIEDNAVDGTVTINATGEITDAHVQGGIDVDGFGVSGEADVEDGVLQVISASVKGTVEVEGVPVGLEAKGGYELTEQGYKTSGEVSASIDVDGLGTVKTGIHGGYEDKGGGGDFAVNVGHDETVTADFEGLGMVTLGEHQDVNYGMQGGQETLNVQVGSDAGAAIAGVEIAHAGLGGGVTYVTGPDGEGVTLDAQAGGTLGNDDLGQVGGGVQVEEPVWSDDGGADGPGFFDPDPLADDEQMADLD